MTTKSRPVPARTAVVFGVVSGSMFVDGFPRFGPGNSSLAIFRSFGTSAHAAKKQVAMRNKYRRRFFMLALPDFLAERMLTSKGGNSYRQSVERSKRGRDGFEPNIIVARWGRNSMSRTVNAGARLDRLPISSFHYRIFWLIGAGMFFDGYDLYVAGGVLASTLQTKFSTLPENLRFISLTFVGMTIGALVTGFLGDRFGRRFTYQVNLLVFGLASLPAAFAQDMTQLIACRFVQGLGLGAEIVVGYSTLTEFVPPKTRGRWLSMMAFIVVAGFPVTALLGYLIIPAWGWRRMFIIAGVGSLIVWYLRKNLPESPRWLEQQGRTEEAEALMQAIEKESAAGQPLPPVVVP